MPDIIAALMVPLLATLDRLEAIGRFLHPPLQPMSIESLGDLDRQVEIALTAFNDAPWPEQMFPFRDVFAEAAMHTLRATSGLRAAPSQPNPQFAAGRALRQTGRAQEALYQVANMLPPVSRFFLEPSRREDGALLTRLGVVPPEGTSVMHAGNETGMRGGFTIYIPEYIDLSVPAPIIFSLHGGSGHGRLFLWSWLREARARGCILVAPTARGDTWSLMDPETDSANFAAILADVGRHCAIDPSRRLLTGMSDGGTFTLLSGLNADSPFTHLAPCAASFHPMLLSVSEPERIKGLPIYLIHGAKDWMFPVSMARTSQQMLRAAGAEVLYREIADLSHVYPRDENPRILDWFLQA